MDLHSLLCSSLGKRLVCVGFRQDNDTRQFQFWTVTRLSWVPTGYTQLERLVVPSSFLFTYSLRRTQISYLRRPIHIQGSMMPRSRTQRRQLESDYLERG